MYIELALCGGGTAHVDHRAIAEISPAHCDSDDGAEVKMEDGLTFVVRGPYGALAALVNKPAPASPEGGEA